MLIHNLVIGQWKKKNSILIGKKQLNRRRLSSSSSCISFSGWGSGSSTYNSFMNDAQPIQNQGQCGDCWAFASIAQYELNYYIYKNIQQKQSEEYVLNCVGSSIGNCNGGFPSQTNVWLANYGSCPSLEYNSYDGNDSLPCNNCFSSTTPVGYTACLNASDGRMDTFWNITVNTAQYVGLSFWMGVSNDFFYLSSNSPYWTSCNDTIIGYHAMAIYGQYYGNWVWVRNQWGTNWGSNGWFWLSQNSINSCQFQQDVSFNYW